MSNTFIQAGGFLSPPGPISYGVAHRVPYCRFWPSSTGKVNKEYIPTERYSIFSISIEKKTFENPPSRQFNNI